MPVEIIPAHDVPLAEQARISTDAFEGYVGGSFAFDTAALARLVSTQGIDLCYSRLARNADGYCGFGYVARTGGIARLAGMGVTKAARRTGIARRLLLHLLEEAKTRGEVMMVLEVIEQNPAAHALYRSENFRELDRLLGWRRAANAPVRQSLPEPAAGVHETPLLEASQLPGALDFPELPWQISRHAAAKLMNGRAYSSGRAMVLIDVAESTGPIRTCGLFSHDIAKQDWTEIRAVFSAVLHAWLNREFFAPPIFPQRFGREIFAPLGFQEEPLRQFLMGRDL
jgi:ribosomal protein S18 acetylase RimI-like enzyme